MLQKPILRISLISIVLISMALMLNACNGKCVSDEQEKLEFTVCEAGRLPDELVRIIEEKKAEPFKLSFITREYMYIVVGYGAQPRGGCCVTVDSLYKTSQAVYIDTNLIGTEGSEIRIDGMSYPYVAVKCENQELPVVYQ